MISGTDDGVMLIGKVGTAPRVTVIAGKEMATFPIEAKTTRWWIDNAGRRQTAEGRVWFQVVGFNPRVVNALRSVDTHDMVAVEGSIERRSLVSNGSQKEVIEIVAERILPLTSRAKADFAG